VTDLDFISEGKGHYERYKKKKLGWVREEFKDSDEV
jgi:hypothetical protein